MKLLYSLLLGMSMPMHAFRMPPLLVAQNATPRIGRTHFIVGQPFATYEKPQIPVKPASPTSYSSPRSCSIYFSPDDNVAEKLQSLIQEETEAVKIAIFMLTDKTIANALIAAKNRGVSVELVTDAGCLRERSSKIGHACDNGCMVYVYNPAYQQQENSSLMHHKFALFANNVGRKLVWTGSYNFTKAAKNGNQENAILLDDETTYARFSEQFEKLKTRSYRYGANRHDNNNSKIK